MQNSCEVQREEHYERNFQNSDGNERRQNFKFHIINLNFILTVLKYSFFTQQGILNLNVETLSSQRIVLFSRFCMLNFVFLPQKLKIVHSRTHNRRVYTQTICRCVTMTSKKSYYLVHKIIYLLCLLCTINPFSPATPTL